ncbi:MAG: hypothetical protein ACLR7Z_16500 [Bilophila wadsworthia]
MNMLTISLLQSTADVHIGFFEWTAIGMPMVSCSRRWRGGSSSAFPGNRARGMDLVGGNTPDSAGLGGGKRVHRRAGRELHPLEHGKAARHPLPVAAVIGCAIFSLPTVELLTWEQDKGRIGWDSLMLIGASNALGGYLGNGRRGVDRPCLSAASQVCRLQVL